MDGRTDGRTDGQTDGRAKLYRNDFRKESPSQRVSILTAFTADAEGSPT